MASLWSLIHKKRQIFFDGDIFSHDDFDSIGPIIVEAQPKLINITEHVLAWQGHSLKLDPACLDVTPPFSCLWFEWLLNLRHGILTFRTPATAKVDAFKRHLPPSPLDARYLVQMLLCVELNGDPGCVGEILFYIDALGRPITDTLRTSDAGPNREEQLRSISLYLADVITTMNTRGTRIEPPFDSKPTQIVKPSRAPCSVWHTIHIPKLAHPPLVNAEVSSEILERREHWVRGHRRDYRRGNGMFGRVKALVWVPEFQRGNPELGTVMQSYEVRKEANHDESATTIAR